VSLTSIIKIDKTAGIPIYRQIINSVYMAIDHGDIAKGDKIPSLNQFCKEFSLSRDTVMVALNELKSRGIVASVPGKGYYIESTNLRFEKRVFLLFDELNVFKEDIYTSFLKKLDTKTTVDIFFHHFNYSLFQKLISDAAGKYNSYVIMPATFDNSQKAISSLPENKVFILDRKKDDLINYPVIYQDFEQDVIDALNEGKELLRKYDKLIMVYPGGKEPIERVHAFKKFCSKYDYNFEVIDSLENRKVKSGEVYFVVSDRNLVKIVKIAAEKKLKLGENLGIVSFNDTDLKEVVAGGITTISTDFNKMGENLSELILQKKARKLRNPSSLIIRNSL
jgi:DNA-binding transcriptional regulator YhcF (GntR family)